MNSIIIIHQKLRINYSFGIKFCTKLDFCVKDRISIVNVRLGVCLFISNKFFLLYDVEKYVCMYVDCRLAKHWTEL